MKAKDGFDAAIQRAEHFLKLYEILHDTRSRGVRSDWADRFKEIMHWPEGEDIVRVDGKDRESILILRPSVGVDRGHFSHEYVTELLRAAVVAAVSALDNYLHDLVVERSWGLLCRPETDIPSELKKLYIPVVATKKALDKLRKDPQSRPGTLVKQAIQEQLHRDFTFQNPDSILKAAKMLGIEDFWGRVSKEMKAKSKEDVIQTLKNIMQRRNQIVHEADLVRKTRARKLTFRDISESCATDWLEWVKEFVKGVHIVVERKA